MKKIFCAILFIFFIKNVYGIENCETNSDKESLWYKIEEESKYFRLNENDNTYPLLDEKSFYKTDFTNWINVKPIMKPGREIEERKIFVYQNRLPSSFFLHTLTSEKKYNKIIKEEMEYRYRDTFYRYYRLRKIYDSKVRKKGTVEYPYKEIGILSSQKHCFQNKIITFKNINISSKFLSKKRGN